MKIYNVIVFCGLFTLASLNLFGQGMDLSIDQAVETAFKNSPELRAKLAQIKKAQAGYAESKTVDNVTVTGEIVHTQQGPKVSMEIPGAGSATIAPSYNTTGTVTLVKPLDISKKFSLISDLSQYQIEMSKIALESSAQNLIFNVQRAAFNYLRAVEARKVAQSAVDSSKARLENARAKFEVGSLPKFDVTRAEVELANLNQRLTSTASAINTARAALNMAMGIDVSNSTNITELPSSIAVLALDINKETMIADALKNRPEVRSVNTAIDMGKRNLKLQQTGTKPSASVVGRFNHNFKATGFSSDKDSWAAMLSFQMPIWEGGATRTKVDQAKADIESAEDMLEQAKLGVTLDVEVALININDAVAREHAAKENVSLAEEALRLANVRYDAGISTLVEVTDAETALSETRYNYVNALFDYAIARADLDRSVFSQNEMKYIDSIGAQR